MSPQTRYLIVGLSAPGLLWLATRGLAGPEGNPGAAGVSSASPSPTVILLSNGRLLHGELREDGAGYELKQKGGSIRFPRGAVEKTFGSIQEVYRYKLGRLPREDPDEQMKLARWCLSQGLNAEARERLAEVVARYPTHAQAKAMLQNLALAAERPAPTDPEVARTAATGPAASSAPAPDRPGELTSEVLEQIRRGRGQGSSTRPVIFDLPPALAVRRFQEFAGYVHPELQRHCAGCHNEHSSRPFQLIEAKSRRDLGNHLLVTTNLDATLRQVDRENPAKSEVLVNAILPHGPAGRPILSGPNHPSYQRLATWVHSLKGPPKPAEAVAAPGVFAPAAPAPNEGFASARPSSPPPEAPAPAAPIDPGGAPSPGAQVATYRGSATHPAVPPNADFRTSPLLGGSGPVPAPTPGVPAPQPLGAAGPQAITLPGGEVVPVDTRALSRDDPADRAEASKKKPIKVDPALLEKILSGKAPR